MDSAVQSRLFDLNRQFYQTFGPAFASTRRRIQPGVRCVLERLAAEGNPAPRWADLGCGAGALASAWAKTFEAGAYWGLDSSDALLEEARAEIAALEVPSGLEIRFIQADLAGTGWVDALRGQTWDGLLCFAVLHHLPGADLRRDVLRQARELLPAGGRLILSAWQFQHSARLRERVLPWERAGLRADDVEAGDTLLDWRHALPGQQETVGLRYVHLFSSAELRELAGETGFSVVEEFESDGQGGRLGLYQIWTAA